MNFGNTAILSTTLMIIMSLLMASLLLTLVRLIRGPSLANRVVALNLMSTLTVGTIVVYAIAVNQAVFLDVASILALVAFLSTVAFARYIELRRS